MAYRTALIGTGAALAAVGALTACSPTTEKDAPATSSSTSSPAPTSTATSSATAPAATPTEKAISPGGGNSFSPTVNPVPPGSVCAEIVNGVCVR